MAGINKRSLYQPAATGRTKEPRRKALAQGILGDSGTYCNDESDRSSSEVHSQIGQEQKKKIASTLQLQHSDIKTPERSQKKPKDADILEHFQTPEKGIGVSGYRNEVLVVDASGPVYGNDSTEISTTTHKVFSPAKVICHSPSPEREARRSQSNDTGDNYTMKVDSPPKIIFEDKDTLANETNNDTEQDSTGKLSKHGSKLQGKPTKKKNKAPRIIQSRYKNPKESKPPKVAKDNSTIGRAGDPSFINDISAIASHSMVEGPLKGQDAKKKKAKVTSTPFDPSAWSERTRVVADGSYLDLSRHMGNVDVRTHMTTKDEKKKPGHSTHGGKSTNADSGIALGNQAKESFTKQEKEAKDQIYNIWQENQKLKSEIRQLEQTVHAKKQTMALDQLLKIQDAGLRPLDESLDRLRNNYSTMGEALDNTRHYIQVEDVVVTDQEKLIAALKESQMLLAEISSYTGTKQLNVEKMATNLSQMVEKLAAEVSNLDKCQDLLVAANTLTTYERSMQSQILEADGK
ncbi:HAUS augmin-like complex subunit 8 isoform X2 [Rhopilema esculentum]|uniref:HAUS augmin-like complex subunit 8 isoform X2 n=1 Tax=Rhopilema esculentum TaxID=499914 RepID=UPI0031E02EBB